MIDVARKKTPGERLKQDVERIFNEKRHWVGVDNIMLQVSVATGI